MTFFYFGNFCRDIYDQQVHIHMLFFRFQSLKTEQIFFEFPCNMKKGLKQKKVSCFLAVDLDRSKEMADFIDSSNGCMK